jgi:transposase
MARRSYTREFKLEAIRLVSDHGVSIAQAARDLDLQENTLRSWMRQYREDPAYAFPGAGQMKPEQAELARLRQEVRKLKAERDILKKASAYFAKELK